MAEIGFHPLLLEIERDLLAPDVVGDHAAHRAVQHRHPHHEAGNRIVLPPERECKRTGKRPQNAHKAGQGDDRVQQPHAERDGVAGELVDVFLNPLVRVVGVGAVDCGCKARQFHLVKGLMRHPLVQVVVGHPGAPAHFEQLGQVELVDRDHDKAESQVREPPELLPEHGRILLLERVVKQAVPVVKHHRHVDQGQVEGHDRCQHAAGLPFVLRRKVGRGQRHGALDKCPERRPFGGHRCHKCHAKNLG